MLLAWLRRAPSLSLLLLNLLVSAQTIFPSNSSVDLYPASSSPRFFLNGTEMQGMASVPLAPLDRYAQIDYSDFVSISATGQLVNVGASNANHEVSRYQFSYVSCDPTAYTGNLDASAVFNIIVNEPRAAVIILYSETSDHCGASNLGSLPADIQSVLTTTDPDLASQLAQLNLNADSPGVCVITPDLSSYTNNTSLPGGTTSSSGTSTTAVAMIVLYSITGLITALFVVIIISGTVRAHRHPERYGPTATSGRGRQSRAKGIARAMLDTLPIVKFSGDREATNLDHQKPESDIELGAPGSAATTAQNDIATTTTTTRSVLSQPPAQTTERNDAAPTLKTRVVIPSEPSTAASSSTSLAGAHPASGSADDYNELGCAICTEDFTQGEEMRVLPCNHKFHPECVDPWLLNVSGTCPLCRIDLRTPGETDEEEEDGNAGLPPPMGHAPADSPDGAGFARRRDTITFAHLRSLASRNAGGASNSNSGAGPGALSEAGEDEEEEETEQQRRGLARRFRERFRIRTERSGDPASTSAPGPVAAAMS
ncbi:hypothetical protein DV735_g2234, partial [Chaetothyriales sp. CBS 134920]